VCTGTCDFSTITARAASTGFSRPHMPVVVWRGLDSRGGDFGYVDPLKAVVFFFSKTSIQQEFEPQGIFIYAEIEAGMRQGESWKAS
jgi:hypothetical protein